MKITLDDLRRYADALNGQFWVRDSMRPYFVNKRDSETGVVHFLDRR